MIVDTKAMASSVTRSWRPPAVRGDLLLLGGALPVLALFGAAIAFLAEQLGPLKLFELLGGLIGVLFAVRDLRLATGLVLLTLGVPLSAPLGGFTVESTHVLLAMVALQMVALASAGILDTPRRVVVPAALMTLGGGLAALTGPDMTGGLERLAHGFVLPAVAGIGTACAIRSGGLGRLPVALAAGLAGASLAAYAQSLGLAPWILPPVENGRVGGLLGNPNLLGGFLVPSILVLMGVGSLSWRSYRGGAMIFFVPVALALGALALTLSRGAMLSLAVGLAVMICLLFAGGRAVASLAILLAIAVAVAVTVPQVPESKRAEVLQRFQQLRRPGTETGRRLLYREAVINIRESWLLGKGPLVFGKIIKRRERVGGLEQLPHAHSIVLETWLSLGLIGLLSLTWLLVGAARRFLRLSRRAQDDPAAAGWAIGGLSALVAMLVQGVADFVFISLDVMTLAFVVVTSAYALADRQAALPPTSAT